MLRRQHHASELERRLTGGKISLEDFASGHEYFGLHFRDGKWHFNEWAPNAEGICLVGDFSDWKESDKFRLTRGDDHGKWHATFPADTFKHGDLYRLRIRWPGGAGDRIPSCARRVVQDASTKIFNAQVWMPTKPYRWANPGFQHPHATPLVYEAHIGMAQQEERVGTYTEFRDGILPRVADAGYNTLLLMALMEHPYYGSFGYHVSSFFAATSRFGTPEELKSLIDAAHGKGISVIMDFVHSHAVSNEVEGLSRFDGTPYQYFHDLPRGHHPAWDSRCFDYAKPEVLHFLLSNCRYWLDEFKMDGFRFDGVTSMLYLHHGLGPGFNNYGDYFNDSVDEDAIAYLTMANKLIHTLRPDAITIAEDVSGMPGLAAPIKDGGLGFDYRLAMGVPDCWFKLACDVPDENWNMGYLWHELTNRRADERTISYVESHDQSLVGGKTMIFELIDAAMYHSMQATDTDPLVDRGMALHKMSRLATIASAGSGYLNFIGNEFGHPEWVDFPREGNNWSYHHARRLSHLRDDQNLKYHFLADFDKAMIEILGKSGAIDKAPARLLTLREDDKIIVMERAGYFLLFNWHPTKSVADYPVDVPPGDYSLQLDTDETRFGGHGRIAPGQCYAAIPTIKHNVLHHRLSVYLPCRTALVVKRITPSAAHSNI
ncbi:MAG: alpha-amylase family glycosyl hydrolase [bacterium]